MSKIGKFVPGLIKQPIVSIVNGCGRLKGKIYLAARSGKIWFPDKAFQKWDYKVNTGRKLSFKNPTLYQEKLQWMKYYYHNPLYTKLVDKYEVKAWVADRIGKEHVTETYGIYDSYDEIDFGELPERFVIKCTHDSGSVVLCLSKSEGQFKNKDGATLNISSVRDLINKGLKQNHFYLSREWPYKNVKPRIIIEEYLHDDVLSDPPDYKFFCFEGIVKVFQVNSDRMSNTGTKTNFYRRDWTLIDMEEAEYGNNPLPDNKPNRFDEMLGLAETLSKGMPHVRVDFYYINNNVYFGEMTFYHCGGRRLFKPFEYNVEFGKWIQLPHKIR